MRTESVYLALRAGRAALLSALLGAALVALVPAAFGWRSTVVSSGSMAPAIRTGDVVVVAPVRDPRALRVGDVVLARDPGGRRELLLHRIVGKNPDGTLTTKGDANLSPDSAPMPPGNVVGVGRLRVPLIGVPVLRARAGDPVPAVALALTVMIAAGVRLRGKAAATPAGR